MRPFAGVLGLLVALAFAGCQQTQEAPGEADDETTVIEKETVVEPADQPDTDVDVQVEPPAEPNPDVDVQMEGRGEGVSGEVKVEGN